MGPKDHDMRHKQEYQQQYPQPNPQVFIQQSQKSKPYHENCSVTILALYFGLFYIKIDGILHPSIS